MKKIVLLLPLLFITKNFSQTKNFIDLPYIETSAKVDTLVTPDRIFLTILITEKDTKNKTSVEELESKMNLKLKSLGIITEKQLTLNDLTSNYKKYFLKQQDILKTKSYSLVVYDAKTASKVIAALEEEEISNVSLEKTEYSKTEQLLLLLKGKAIVKAKNTAVALTKPLNQKVGNTIYISDSNSSVSNMLSGRVPGVQIRGFANMNAESDYDPIDVAFDKIKIETQINVNFKLE
ncbi:MAG: SIMPL domain-containing protein [Flavobacterium sp.]|jgi:uncharacterized protein YggE|nr:SIMPL domain-containing protein [Flavobacterium sp.]